ncbi:MAG: hypothetical protein JXA74_02640 [Anaerolineae bacterium]|nr:hypothetical protein [Anaerolineae bacterium]
MIILLLIALALVMITALDANIRPGSTRSGRIRTSGRRNPKRVTPRRRPRQASGRETLTSRQIWSF